MTVPIVTGAALACSFGMSPSPLTVVPNPAAIGTPATNIATIRDFAVGVNISSFGMCTSPANPAVQAATTAASGVFTPAPCVPIISAPWAPPSIAVQINAVPAALSTSTCLCTWGGVIAVTSPGQVAATAT